MKTVEGSSTKGDFAEALKQAIGEVQKLTVGDMQYIWKLHDVHGRVGGITGENSLVVELEVHGIYLAK